MLSFADRVGTAMDCVAQAIGLMMAIRCLCSQKLSDTLFASLGREAKGAQGIRRKLKQKAAAAFALWGCRGGISLRGHCHCHMSENAGVHVCSLVSVFV